MTEEEDDSINIVMWIIWICIIVSVTSSLVVLTLAGLSPWPWWIDILPPLVGLMPIAYYYLKGVYLGASGRR